MLQWLDNTTFCRSHRNFIVNMEKIIEIVPADNLIILQENHTVTLSERYKGIINQFRMLK